MQSHAQYLLISPFAVIICLDWGLFNILKFFSLHSPELFMVIKQGTIQCFRSSCCPVGVFAFSKS